jgi:AcrR family transcriptional regulator
VSPRPTREPHHLPSGRHALSKDEVVRNQRSRVTEAVADVSSVAGYAPMTVEDIIVTAGISRRSFYDLFSSKEDAFLKALDDVCGRLFTAVRGAFDSTEGFAERMEASIGAVLQFFSANPSYAEMCLIQVMAAGPDATDRRNDSLQRYTALVLEAVDKELPKRGRPPEIVAEGIIGGIYEILYARVIQGRVNQLPDLLPDLMYSALLPYVGPAKAVDQQRRVRRRGGQAV